MEGTWLHVVGVPHCELYTETDYALCKTDSVEGLLAGNPS